MRIFTIFRLGAQWSILGVSGAPGAPVTMPPAQDPLVGVCMPLPTPLTLATPQFKKNG